MRAFAVVVFSLFVGFFSVAQAQFTVGGVTGGAATANINCYGDADGKLRAYTDGWRAADCGVYSGICKASEYPCAVSNNLCDDGVNYGPCTPPSALIDVEDGPKEAGDDYAAATNQPPVINTVSCSNAIVDKAYTCQITAVDTDAVTYSIAGAPSWLSINTSTGAMTGTPNSKTTESTFTVTATDSYGKTDTETVNAITVGNTAPLWNSHPVACETAAAGAQYSCAMSASDSDLHTLTYSLVNSPSWMSIDASTGVITGTPDTSTDFSNLEVRVTDGHDPVSATTFNVTIANNAPAFASFSCPTVGTIGSAYSCSPTASDADTGHTITYGLLSAPSWMSIDASTGVITGTVANAAGSGVTVTASDTYDTTSAAAFNVAINNAPTISSVSCADGLDTAAYTCSVSASDSDSGDSLTYTIANKPSWASISSSGVITGTAQTGTTSNITVTVSDGNASATSNSFTITIDPNTATVLANTSSTLSTSDVDDLETLGVATNIVNDLKTNNNCGSAGNQSCLTAFNNQKASSSCTLEGGSSATGAQMQAYVSCVMIEHHTAVVSSAALGGGSNVTAGCSSTVNLSIPGTCGHPQWSCTLTSAPSSWTLSGANIVIPANYSGSGSQTATVRMSLNIYSPAYTKDVTKTYNVAAAVTGAQNGKKRYSDIGTSFNPTSARSKCIARGGRLATKDEHNSIGGTKEAVFAPNTSNPSVNYNNNCSDSNSYTWCWSSNTCEANNHYGRARRRSNNGSLWCKTSQGSSQVNRTIYYTCADLPSCS